MHPVQTKCLLLLLLGVSLMVASSSAHMLSTKSVCQAFELMSHKQFEAFIELHPDLIEDVAGMCDSKAKLGDAVNVDFHTEDNLKSHNTADYRGQINEKLRLVLRRGQSFKLSLKGATSDIKCKIGATALDAQVNGDDVSLALPVNAPVGRYDLSCSGASLGTVSVLFNPWNDKDDVFLNDDAARGEYVLGQVGRMWLGDVYNDGIDGADSISWTYDQFDVHQIILDLVDMTPQEIRSDVRLLSRALTWMINSVHNPKGVLAGNWGGDYSGGKSPSSWTGSGAIYETWKQQGFKPTRYGQCWVFGGTLTTALRSLGVPSRPLTNFRSAHDSPPYDGVIDQNSHESIWNFHVWVDAWMNRDGQLNWNAVDATPQEASDGKYQMGPSFLPLVHDKKDGKYDNKFVISEVAAAVWLGQGAYDGSSTNPADFDYKDVGRLISTKKIGCVTQDNPHECRDDITAEYKKTDASRALRQSLLHPSIIDEDGNEAHQFETKVLPARPIIGEDFRVLVRPATGLKLAQPVDVLVTVNISMITYSGKYVGDVRVVTKQTRLSPPDSDDSAIDNVALVRVLSHDYVSFLEHANGIRIRVNVEGHGDVEYVYQGQLQLLPQKLAVTPSVPSPQIGDAFSVALSFTNPLGVPLTNAVLHINLPQGDRVVPIDNIPAFGEFRYTVKDVVIPSRGHSVIAFSLDTKELKYIFGSKEYLL